MRYFVFMSLLSFARIMRFLFFLLIRKTRNGSLSDISLFPNFVTRLQMFAIHFQCALSSRIPPQYVLIRIQIFKTINRLRIRNIHNNALKHAISMLAWRFPEVWERNPAFHCIVIRYFSRFCFKLRLNKLLLYNHLESTWPTICHQLNSTLVNVSYTVALYV